MSLLESRTLHFDLSSFSQDKEYTLLAGQGRKHVLKRYADHPSKLAEHRDTNRALGFLPEAQMHRITHFFEGCQMDGVHANMRRVVFPSLDDHPLPEIAMAFFHVPRTAVRRAHRRLRSLGRTLPHPLALHTYGVESHRLHSLAIEDQFALLEHAADIKPPGVTAQAIVLNHPELGTADGTIVEQIVTQYLQFGLSFSELVQYIQDNPPGSQDQWYNKSYVLWSANEDGTGPMVPAVANTDLKYKEGGQPDWPVLPSGPAMPTYNLTDQFDPPPSGAGTGVIGAAGPIVDSVLIATKNDPAFNGLLWTRQSGVTEKLETDVPPTSGLPSARAAAGTVGAVGAGFGIKNITSSYGLYLYDDKLAFDFDKKTLSFPVKNWPSRYLGAYVEFLKQDGTAIPRADIKAANPSDPGKPYTWQDNLPDIAFIRKIAENSTTKNYLTWLSSGNAIFGAPVPPLTQETNLTFLWPDDASRGMVLLGGLGVANGFSDWDTDVDIVGVMGTGIVNYGVGTVVLLLNVYVINPFVSALAGADAQAFYALCGVLGTYGLIIGVGERDTSFGKFVLSKLASLASGFIFGAFFKRLITAGAIKAATIMAKAAGELVAEITAQEALEQVPVAGWALRVVSIAADIAGLTATTIECLLSPATYQLEILRTMNLTVTVSPDPTHGKDGFKPVWPLVASHHEIQVKYPSGNNQQGGTTYTKAGPMPAQHDDPIVVTFIGIPAGGKIDIAANVYSSTNWLAGRWDSGWVNATPDKNDELSASGSIVELLVPLTPTTLYSQKQTIAYSTQRQHFWIVTQFGLKPTLAPDLDKGGAPDADLQAAFAANGNPLGASAAIVVNTKGSNWTVNNPASGDSFQVTLRLISNVKIFQLTKATYLSALNAGGATPANLAAEFTKRQFPLPEGTTITVIASGSQWSIGLPGQPSLYALAADGTNINVNDTQYQLTVQNTANFGPPLPKVYPLPSGPTGNQLGALQNVIINDLQFVLGYAWMASGQNLPLDDGKTNTNVPMYTMQSISTLGQPQEQIIQPTRGFSLPSFLAYDQFGLTPLFPLDAKFIGQLKNGPVPPDVVKEFAAFGIQLPADAQLTVVVADKDWTIGQAGKDPLYELRVMTVILNDKPVTQVGVFSWPIPKIDNFYLDPRDHTKENPVYYLRGVDVNVPGASEFNYDKALAWGRISTPGTIQGLAVHPQGYVVAVDFEHHKLFALKLPADALPSEKAPFAMPLSGEGLLEGLMNHPTALTITADGRILILEEGNSRVQAFDVKGNAVPSFAVQPKKPFEIPASFAAELDNQTVSTKLVQAFQQNVIPALAPKFVVESYGQIVVDLDNGVVDQQLVDEFVDLAYANPGAGPADFSVVQTVPAKSWLVTNTKNGAVYNVRMLADEFGIDNLYVFANFTLSITIVSKGTKWKIDDSTNSMSFEVTVPKPGSPLSVQQVVSYFPLRDQGTPGLSYLDIATEAKGYIYVLSVLLKDAKPEFRLDIYNPDGTQLLKQVQTGVNAGRLTVDQYRSMFTLNYNVVLGPGGRTEPGVSAWIPSTPNPAT